MKKMLAALACLVMLTGCSGQNAKIGVGISTSLTKSASASEESDGKAVADVAVAAVTLDSKGKIVKLTIDAVQTRVEFDGQGEILSDLEADVLSKREMGADYGLKKSSSLGKEWDEQIAAFEEWAVGKDAATVLAMTDPSQDETLSTPVDLDLTPYLKALEKAVENAK